MVERKINKPDAGCSSTQRADDAGKESIPSSNNWRRVVFAFECDEYDNCPICNIDYSECDCPGPHQEDEYEYSEDGNGMLVARRLAEADTDRV